MEHEIKPCSRQIHIKISDEDFDLFRKRMKQVGCINMSSYIRKMAIDGYFIQVDFKELLEPVRLLKIGSNKINQIAKIANTCGAIDEKTIKEMKADHERVLKKAEACFDKYLEVM